MFHLPSFTFHEGMQFFSDIHFVIILRPICCSTYLITAPIVPYYYTQLIGDARNPPTLLAAANFDGFAVIGALLFNISQFVPCWFNADANPYIPGGGAQFFDATNNLYVLRLILRIHVFDLTFSFRSIRNFIIDVRRFILLHASVIITLS